MSAEDHYIDELERDNRRLTSLVADLRAELAEEKKISAAWCIQAQEAEEALAKREAVADGFVLVPKKPTREMTMAARANWSGYGEESDRDYDPMWYEVRDVWDAMLSASQPKEKGQ